MCLYLSEYRNKNYKINSSSMCVNLIKIEIKNKIKLEL